MENYKNEKRKYDSDFIEKLKNGNNKAFCELDSTLFKKYRIYLHNKKKIQLNDAKNIVQDVAYNLIKNINSYDPKKGSFEAWSFTILYHCFCDYLRKKKKRQEYPHSNEDFESLRNACNEENLIQKSKQNEIRLPKRIEKLLKKLDDKSKKLIVLWLSGKSKNEIMEDMNISHKEYDNIKYRAIKKMREEVTKKGKKNEDK